MQLLETSRPAHRSDILAVQWDLRRTDATDKVSVQAQEETNWEPEITV